MTAPREPAAGATPAREETLARERVSLPLPSELAATVSVLRSLIPFAARTENLNDAIDAVIRAALRERDAAREDAALVFDSDELDMLEDALIEWHPDARSERNHPDWCEQRNGLKARTLAKVQRLLYGPTPPSAARAAAEGRAT